MFSGSTNLPTGIQDGYLIAFKWLNGNYAMQIIMNNGIYGRYRDNGGTWGEWSKW